MAVKKKPGYVWIPKTKRRLKKGSSRKVDTGGVWRKKRPKGKTIKTSKKVNRSSTRRDEFGRIMGTKSR